MCDEFDPAREEVVLNMRRRYELFGEVCYWVDGEGLLVVFDGDAGG